MRAFSIARIALSIDILERFSPSPIIILKRSAMTLIKA